GDPPAVTLRPDRRAVDRSRGRPAGRHPGARMPFDPAPWRADTEAVAAGLVHLNNAGASLMPRPVHQAVSMHLQREVMHGGYEAAAGAAEAIERTHADVGALIGASGRNIAVVENATVAFSQALSAFDFEHGDV